MKQKLFAMASIVTILSISLIVISSCKKDSDDDTNLFTALFLISQSNNAKVASQTASQAMTAVTTVNSTISTQASGSTLTLGGIPQTQHEIAVNMAKKYLDAKMGKTPTPYIIPTALTTTSGSCSATSCTAVIDGTANCSLGGTFTLSSYTYNATISNSGGTFTFNTTVNGGIGFNACTVQAMDLMTFPNITRSTMTGNATVSGTSNIAFNLSTGTSTITNNINILSTDLTFNSGAATNINMNETSDLTQVATISNLSSSTAGTVTTSIFTMTIVLTGTVNRTGSIGGVSVSNSRTFNGDTFVLNATCTFDTAGSSSCSIN